MKNTNYTVQVLEPDEGFVLTQVEDINLCKRVFSNKIFLSVNDSPENWKEITNKEADILKLEQSRMLESSKL